MTRTSTTRARARSVAALVAVLTTCAALLSPTPAAAAPVGDKPWSGFLINLDRSAGGEFIGARKLRVGGRVVYRIDPRATGRSGTYGAARPTGRLPGSGSRSSASATATARAAWIVGKYGSFKYGVQNAAVDAALLTLLAGRGYGLEGARGSARIRATGFGPEVRRFARTMLDDSARESGPYRVEARQAGSTAVGDPLTAQVSVAVARNGRGVRSLPVQVRVDGGAWRKVGELDGAGRRSQAVPGLSAGPHRVDVRVNRVPDTRLQVLAPTRRAASRVVLAGRKSTATTGFTAAVQARPRVGVRTDDVRRGRPTTPVLGLTAGYGSAPRAARVTLHGPFATRAAATCGPRAGRTLRATVRADGTQRLATVRVRRAGFYTWRATVGGNRYNLPAAACTGGFRVNG